MYYSHLWASLTLQPRSHIEVLKNKVIVLSAVRYGVHIETSPAGRPITAATWNALPERMPGRARIARRAHMLEMNNE